MDPGRAGARDFAAAIGRQGSRTMSDLSATIDHVVITVGDRLDVFEMLL